MRLKGFYIEGPQESVVLSREAWEEMGPHTQIRRDVCQYCKKKKAIVSWMFSCSWTSEDI